MVTQLTNKEVMWKKLSEPPRTWPPTPKTTFNATGTRMQIDQYADGREIDEYSLSTPFAMETATYIITHYAGDD